MKIVVMCFTFSFHASRATNFAASSSFRFWTRTALSSRFRLIVFCASIRLISSATILRDIWVGTVSRFGVWGLRVGNALPAQRGVDIDETTVVKS